MKRLLNAIKWAWTVYRQPQVFQPSMLAVLQAQSDFLKEVAETSSPRITDLAQIYWEDGKKHEVRILSLWCCVGENTPFDRLRELAEENRKLKSQMVDYLQQKQTNGKQAE